MIRIQENWYPEVHATVTVRAHWDSPNIISTPCFLSTIPTPGIFCINSGSDTSISRSLKPSVAAAGVCKSFNSISAARIAFVAIFFFFCIKTSKQFNLFCWQTTQNSLTLQKLPVFSPMTLLVAVMTLSYHSSNKGDIELLKLKCYSYQFSLLISLSASFLFKGTCGSAGCTRSPRLLVLIWDWILSVCKLINHNCSNYSKPRAAGLLSCWYGNRPV